MSTYTPPNKPHIAQQNIYWTISDVLAITRRNLLRYIRLPQLLVFSTIQPVMFLILFAFVFGGAIQTDSSSYINYLIPGVILQTVVFGAMQTGIGLVEDLSRGMIDRFRSLPMARSAVLAGRTLADSIRNIFVIVLMVTIGFLIGFRYDQGIFEAVAALAITLIFGFAFSWISATIGLVVKNVETAQSAGFIWVFPLVFASSIFVPIESMPGWLYTFASANPITLTVDAVRALVLQGEIIPSLMYSLIWSAGILLIFTPLAISRYRKQT